MKEARNHECRGGVCPPLTEGTNVGAKNFSPLTENAKPRRGDICITISKRSAAYGSRGASVNDRATLTTNVIASAAKQPSLRDRRSQSRAFAKTLMFFSGLLRYARNDVPLLSFVLSWLRTFHFQFSIFNFQLLKRFLLCIVVLLFSMSGYSQHKKTEKSKNQNIPEWFFTPSNDEYRGVSLPLSNPRLAEKQAIYLALISYCLQNQKLILSGFSTASTSVTNVEDTNAAFVVSFSSWSYFSLPALNYEVVRSEKNGSDEVFVSLKVSQSNTDSANRIKINFIIDNRQLSYDSASSYLMFRLINATDTMLIEMENSVNAHFKEDIYMASNTDRENHSIKDKDNNENNFYGKTRRKKDAQYYYDLTNHGEYSVKIFPLKSSFAHSYIDAMVHLFINNLYAEKGSENEISSYEDQINQITSKKMSEYKLLPFVSVFIRNNALWFVVDEKPQREWIDENKDTK
jgi:hypothetical protein